MMFLSTLNSETRDVYAAGLKLLRQYYSDKGPIRDSLDNMGA